jgi:hypothetical protein
VKTSCEPFPITQAVDARAYLLKTSRPGYTMMLQGPELSIERLHPEFATRLANAIREARDSGLPSAGIFSAYRPPAFGVGGFLDKFNSLHAYGLAVDVWGIGGAGSFEAELWHEIAAKHGVICPYGPYNRTEWNHCQATSLRMVRAQEPLRDTITAEGPRRLEEMFEVGDQVIENVPSGNDAVPNEGPVRLPASESLVLKLPSRSPLFAAQGTHMRSLASRDDERTNDVPVHPIAHESKSVRLPRPLPVSVADGTHKGASKSGHDKAIDDLLLRTAHLSKSVRLSKSSPVSEANGHHKRSAESRDDKGADELLRRIAHEHKNVALPERLPVSAANDTHKRTSENDDDKHAHESKSDAGVHHEGKSVGNGTSVSVASGAHVKGSHPDEQPTHKATKMSAKQAAPEKDHTVDGGRKTPRKSSHG